MSEIKIHYGVLHPVIDEQIRQQGFKPKSVTIVLQHEEMRVRINHLRLSGLLTDGEATKAFGRLHKRIVKNVIENR